MQVCNAPDPRSFSHHISISQKRAGKIIRILLVLGKFGKAGKNAPSVTGGQRAVTLCAGVGSQSFYLKCLFRYIMTARFFIR